MSRRVAEMRQARAAHPAGDRVLVADQAMADAARAVTRTERSKMLAVWLVALSASVACWAITVAAVVWVVDR